MNPHADEELRNVTEVVDVAIVGAGAAGLMAAIQAGWAAPRQHIVALDGQEKLGAKILISGGGRCNVTHEDVRPGDFSGASANAIRKVLLAFDVDETIEFFEDMGVTLKREETGKLFPTSDKARTILTALVGAALAAGVELRHPFRVEAIDPEDDLFRLSGPHGEMHARRIVLATGGQSVVQTGSDGHGYEMAVRLGHGLTEPLLPALVPLLLPEDHPLCALKGLSTPARLTVVDGMGRLGTACRGSLLFTHFGISGPVTLDVSRHLLMARHRDAAHGLQASFLPDKDERQLDVALRKLGRETPLQWLESLMPKRLAEALCAEAGIDAATTGAQLTKGGRRELAQTVCAYSLPIEGARGWPYAEVTAGGVPLSEVDLRTMQSRVCPGLFLCGEILDVDGRIGGFNFQWAWATGYLAGHGAIEPVAP